MISRMLCCSMWLAACTTVRRVMTWHPRSLQAAFCAFAATLVCIIVFAIRHPVRLSPLYAVAMGTLFAGVLLATRFVLLEREFTVPLNFHCNIAAAAGVFLFAGLLVMQMHKTPSRMFMLAPCLLSFTCASC
jgi:hypothetical protein